MTTPEDESLPLLPPRGGSSRHASTGWDLRAYASPRTAALLWAACSTVTAVLAKALVLALTAFDHAGVPRENLWWPLALFHEDLRLGLGFGALAGVVTFLARGRRGAILTLYGVYLLVAVYGAANIPVARHLSSPLTYAFLHATGSAIKDSFADYVTAANVGLPLALSVFAACLPFAFACACASASASRLRTVIVLAILLGAGSACLLGPHAVSRVATRGLHRNAVQTLWTSTLARNRGADEERSASLDSPFCRSDPGSPAVEDEATTFLTRARGRNLVWVILESTGARFLPFLLPSSSSSAGWGESHPGAGGGEPMPHFAALAADALVFEHAYTAYPESIKGLFSSLCGREPPPRKEASELGVEHVPCRPLASELGRAGYQAGLFHSGWFAYLGMKAVVEGRGFDVLVDAGGVISPFRSSFGVDDAATVSRLLQWLDEKHLGHLPDHPFFAVFMPIAGHHPYHAPGKSNRPLPETSDLNAYLNDLRAADEALGSLRDGLAARGLDDQTTYVIIGDHGEAFREHPGNIAHALYVYEENVHVPLVVAAPGLGLRSFHSRAMASAIDLAPTFLALAGVRDGGTPTFQGRSLLGGRARVARFFTEQGGRRAGLRDGRWKLIVEADDHRRALYDLAADPRELVDVSASEPTRTRRYAACLGEEP